MGDAYIYAAVRTPRGLGRQEGSLHSIKPVSLLTGLMRALQQRHQVDTALIDDVLLGCLTPVADQGANLARIAVLAAGWEGRTAGMQLNRFGASGLEAVNLAAQKVRSGWDELVLAGGVESTSRVATGADGGAWSLDPETSLRTGYVPAATSADLIATLEGHRRAQLDGYALASQQRAAAAHADGRLPSIMPVHDQNGVLVLAADEGLKPATSMATLAHLTPLADTVFDSVVLRHHPQLQRLLHLHTAGNTARPADGAALALVGSKDAGARLGMEPRARILAGAVIGGEPAAAARKALRQARLSVNVIELFEVHESCAAVVLRFLREMDIPADKVNVNGGAIALGDPAGASGCVLLGTLLDELELRRARYGLVAMEAGAGMAAATIIERL
ncbi:MULTISPECIES: acetyl-CoA C-acyltransferase [unclassified Duganella]|uniref:acetyl-CoA C-acyltransferase n=1 Tax=unclassified Duganella TaxID=2636909 RepID=UPI00088DA191|nr:MULTISPECIES: acetyl-CoA C-acyltransferase [unclassified Duganella]SDG58236.1 acetyl-CoA C-acetyltransferase [Duganella sp. OV458]SDJ81177.1 acetyl-CoA C-acetyltransferase [Duganella sp. OV510]